MRDGVYPRIHTAGGLTEQRRDHRAQWGDVLFLIEHAQKSHHGVWRPRHEPQHDNTNHHISQPYFRLSFLLFLPEPACGHFTCNPNRPQYLNVTVRYRGERYTPRRRKEHQDEPFLLFVIRQVVKATAS